jgi:hypothetical protein
MEFRFEAEIIEWRGPAPYFYAPVPEHLVEEVRAVARVATYGWGCVPVTVTIGGVEFTTSLFPKDGTYLVPIKVAVRRKTGVTAGDTIAVTMTIAAERA